ncbi:MAG: gamma-glutamyltransferase [Candidatus Competibacteraceae bacterium]|nr:gamma-glutamyltransferase [Candidatus Competibacteraceae bacterium]
MSRGIVAAGHPGTAEAARLILAEGGNAFDAALGALCAACVCEPVLASLGGGGFLLAYEQGQSRLYDFFVQTPRRRPSPDGLDFEPIQADFGTTRQEFHIGLGAMAVPGTVAGLFAIHRAHGRLPLGRLVEPALEMARQGVVVNGFTAAVFDAVKPIYTRHPQTLSHYAGCDPTRLAGEGERLRQPLLADTLEVLALEGERLFYQGEIAQRLVAACADGGTLTREDLRGYRVELRRPLELDYHGVRLLTNPPPSCGGILIGFALKLLEGGEPLEWGSADYLTRLVQVMALTNRARVESRLHDLEHHRQSRVLLDPALLERYRRQVLGHRFFPRGTTHISVMDRAGRAAALTLSNGEGCGWLIPDTGIMMNNMLGEEDINPHGFHRWPLDTRISSMMAPTLALWPDGTLAALGSGGSNRLRTAIFQVLVNLVDHGMALEAAVRAPRLHFENDFLNLEDGFPRPALEALAGRFPDHRLWDSQSFYFGGAHCVRQGAALQEGSGDPRRGGVWCRA